MFLFGDVAGRMWHCSIEPDFRGCTTLLSFSYSFPILLHSTCMKMVLSLAVQVVLINQLMQYDILSAGNKNTKSRYECHQMASDRSGAVNADMISHDSLKKARCDHHFKSHPVHSMIKFKDHIMFISDRTSLFPVLLL